MNKKNICTPYSFDKKFVRVRNAARMLMLALLGTAFVLLTLAVFHYTQNTVDAVETELCQKMQVSVEQTRNNIDYRFGQAAESAHALMGTLYPYLNSNGDRTVQLQEYTEIRRALAEQLNRHMIARLRLYVPDEKIYSNQLTPQYSINPLSHLGDALPLYQKGGIFWKETSSVRLGLTDDKQVVSCVVALKSQTNYNKLAGVLFADVTVTQLQAVFAVGSTGRDEMFLVNAQGRILVHPDDLRIGATSITPALMETFRAQGTGYLLDSNVILAFSQLETADWYIVASMPRMHAYSMDAVAANTIVVLWVVACLILFVIAVTVAYNLNLDRTVSRINRAIRSLDLKEEFGTTENVDAVFPPHKKGLISLERNTEQIVRSVAEVVEARYRDRLAISEYQMDALQAQIKPHFLYNTLDVIKWMILDKNLNESVWMVNALSKYLRMSINKGEVIVPLSEELALTRTYLGIIQKRFAHQFEVQYDLDDGALDCLIPKLSLQPLVENALLHGILNCEKPNKCLTIRTWHSDTAFGIELEDNGKGMSPEKAQSIAEMSVHASKSYGVANVHKRLDIFGHGQCKFFISSREGLGTCIMIELPQQPIDL